MNAKAIFNTHIAPNIDATSIGGLENNFAALSHQDYQQIVARYTHRYGITERQKAAIIGYKDEFFCLRLAQEIIKSQGRRGWVAEQVTSNSDARMCVIDRNVSGRRQKMYLKGDLVLFKNAVPQAIVSCHEYVDATRVKQVLGEAHLWDIAARNSSFIKPEFIVFTNVLELTTAWAAFLRSGDILGSIDTIIVARAGKRKDRTQRPIVSQLQLLTATLSNIIQTR